MKQRWTTKTPFLWESPLYTSNDDYLQGYKEKEANNLHIAFRKLKGDQEETIDD